MKFSKLLGGVVRCLIIILFLATQLSCARSTRKATVDDDDSAGGSTSTTETDTDTAYTDADVSASFALAGPSRAGHTWRQTINVTLTYPDDSPVVGYTPEFTIDGLSVDSNISCTASDANGLSVCTDAVSSTIPQQLQVSSTKPSNTTNTLLEISLPETGYVDRPCGFDMNGNGIVGEPEDCNVCDGVTLNVDGDPANEDLIYVDADTGNNGSGDGSPGNPYLTIQYAMDQADGPNVGEQDIICIAGTFYEEVTIKQSGKTGEVRTLDFVEIPTQPLMIVGWDKDNDGHYPPYDPDDTAVLDGQKGANWRAFIPDDGVNQHTHIEIAHMEVKDYDDAGNGSRGNLLHASYTTEDFTHYNVHDIQLDRIAEDSDSAFGKGIINVETTTGKLAHIRVENLQVIDVGGRAFRFRTSDHLDSGYFYFGNVSSWLKAAPGGNPSIYLFRGLANIIVERAMSDSNLSAWDAGQWTTFVGIFAATQNVYIRFNRIIDGAKVLDIWNGSQPSAPLKRNIDNIFFYNNWADFLNQAAIFISNASAATEGPTATIEDIFITSNYFKTTGAVLNAIRISEGNDFGAEVGFINIIGNTFRGNTSEHGLYASSAGTNNQNNFNIVGNIFDLDASGAYEIFRFSYLPTMTNFEFDYNVFYDATSPEFFWNGSTYTTLVNLQGDAVPINLNSQQCLPTFVTEYSLDSADTCAKSNGIDFESYLGYGPIYDFEGTPRPQGAPDIGAHEIP